MANPPPLELDPHTFGNSPAAVILIDKLNNEIRDAALARSVIKFIQRTQNGFCRLNEIDDDDWFNQFRCLWVKERVKLVDFHPEIDSYIKNVIKTDSVEWYRSTLPDKRIITFKKRRTMNRQGVLSK